jgi:hypothetical protein
MPDEVVMRSKSKNAQFQPYARLVPPALSELGLSADELGALRRCGFITSQRRGRQRLVYKLRSRIAGKQFTRSLGTDGRRAEAVRAAVTTWQASRLIERRITRRGREFAALLRSFKSHLAKSVASAGLAFRGRHISKPRSSRT